MFTSRYGNEKGYGRMWELSMKRLSRRDTVDLSIEWMAFWALLTVVCASHSKETTSVPKFRRFYLNVLIESAPAVDILFLAYRLNYKLKIVVSDPIAINEYCRGKGVMVDLSKEWKWDSHYKEPICWPEVSVLLSQHLIEGVTTFDLGLESQRIIKIVVKDPIALSRYGK